MFSEPKHTHTHAHIIIYIYIHNISKRLINVISGDWPFRPSRPQNSWRSTNSWDSQVHRAAPTFPDRDEFATPHQTSNKSLHQFPSLHSLVSVHLVLIMSCIWVNNNILLTWNKAIWGWFPYCFPNHHSRVRSQWGRDEIYPDVCHVWLNWTSLKMT
jgi:hypothetical protein